MSTFPVRRLAVALAVAVGPLTSSAAAQADPYAAAAPAAAYLMERSAEVRLARSAAPDSVSAHATVLVLGPAGYEQAEAGTNGFTCFVARGWMGAFDWPEFWSPKVRAADCMNAQAARFVVPLARLRSELAMAGRSKGEILSAVAAAYAEKRLPRLESGAMEYMTSPSAYLTDAGEHNAPHLMFMTAGVDAADWGADVANSPIMSAPYWFFSATDRAEARMLPAVRVFLVGVGSWSDGTPAGH